MKNTFTKFLISSIVLFSSFASFGQCIPEAMVTGGNFCSFSSTVNVRVRTTDPQISYQAFLGNVAVSAHVTGNGSNLIIPIPTVSLPSQSSEHIITVRGSSPNCGTETLPDTALLRISTLPDLSQHSVIGDTICNDESTAIIRLINTIRGLTYSFMVNQAQEIRVVSSGGDLNISVPRSMLMSDSNAINVFAHESICAQSVGSTIIRIMPLPSAHLSVKGDTVCENAAFATVTIQSSQVNQVYALYNGNTFIKYDTGNGGNRIVPIPLSSLNIGRNSISVHATFQACQTIYLRANADILVHAAPDLTFEATGSWVLGQEDSATVTITSHEPGINFFVSNGTLPIDTILPISRSPIHLRIPVSLSVNSDFIITIRAIISGCSSRTYSDTALIRVNRMITSLSGKHRTIESSVWPNPVKDQLHISSPKPFSSLIIRTISGEIIFQSDFILTEKLSLELKLEQGIYLGEIVHQDGSSFRKIIKE